MLDLFLVLLIIVGILIGVAFLTLLERKVLGYIQIRMGPNKVFFMGLFQPFSDAIKLFTKEVFYPVYSNNILFYFGPFLLFFLSLFLWMILPMNLNLINLQYSVLFFLCVIGGSVYGVMLCGWASNSNYAMLGMMRSMAQSISYEIFLSLIIMSLVFYVSNYNLYMFKIFQSMNWFIMFLGIFSLMWLVSILAELNRTPFDFAEGESELVSGFNIEYGFGLFAMIFLAEYCNILFMSMMFIIFFMGGDYNFMFSLKLVFISSIIIMIRGLMPRYRYDKLMELGWKIFLILSLLIFLMSISLKLISFNFKF
uniref:NADH-ubiquinone oxidoreductase chain 1 n=1 Tax=Orthotrichia sp. XG-2021 TaxID=2996738 RepID=A0A9E8LP51_9NEOP|nr:NADH dehydrogenase subunit 1 [Orthotrichia sp. XG-2021]